jgi:uncharacterized protein YbaP (TraB family)
VHGTSRAKSNRLWPGGETKAEDGRPIGSKNAQKEAKDIPMHSVFSKTRLTALSAAALLGLQGCAATLDEPVAEASQAGESQSTQTAETIAEPASPAGPAMWKVADEDTTIYLFGTVHALPDDIDWYSGTIADALDASDLLVTEIDGGAAADPAAQQIVMGKAVSQSGKTVRDVLSDEQRASYEAAMTHVGLPIEAFDQFKPWFAGMTLSVLPLMKEGFSAQSGVEMVIGGKAGPEKARDALETVEYQIGVFDGLPQSSQIAFLMGAADGVDQIVPTMNAMVEEWVSGDPEGLAEIMNASLTDEPLAEALLYQRNRNWAEWIETRMATSGTVFMAVGAGHLAGEKSVQDYLEQRNLMVTRVQ